MDSAIEEKDIELEYGSFFEIERRIEYEKKYN